MSELVRQQPECLRRVIRVARCYRHIISNRDGIRLINVCQMLGNCIPVNVNAGWINTYQRLQKSPRSLRQGRGSRTCL